MKIITFLYENGFEIQTNADAMLIGDYYDYPIFKHGFWWRSNRVMISDNNQFEGI